MIIIERSYNIDSSRGGRPLYKVDRKVFSDNDIEGVQEFLNERSEVSGYPWFNLEYNFIKL
jgi:hypothetical protein